MDQQTSTTIRQHVKDLILMRLCDLIVAGDTEALNRLPDESRLRARAAFIADLLALASRQFAALSPTYYTLRQLEGRIDDLISHHGLSPRYQMDEKGRQDHNDDHGYPNHQEGSL